VEACHGGIRDRDRFPSATVVHFVSSTVLSKLSCLSIMPIIVKLFTCTCFNISVGGAAGERGWGGVGSGHVRCLPIRTINTEHAERDPFTSTAAAYLLCIRIKRFNYTSIHISFFTHELGPPPQCFPTQD